MDEVSQKLLTIYSITNTSWIFSRTVYRSRDLYHNTELPGPKGTSSRGYILQPKFPDNQLKQESQEYTLSEGYRGDTVFFFFVKSKK